MWNFYAQNPCRELGVFLTGANLLCREMVVIGDGPVPQSRWTWQVAVERGKMLAAAIDALISDIYEAEVDIGAWQRIADALAKVVPETGVAVLIARDKGLPEVYVHAGYPAGAVEEFVAHHVVLCPWNDVVRDSRLGTAYSIEDVLPLAGITYSKFYRDWLIPHGLGGGFGVKMLDAPECSASLVLHCSADQAQTEKSHVLGLLTRLAPHLQRAIERSRGLHAIWAAGVREGIALSADAKAVLEGNTTVIATNSAMEIVLAEGMCAISASKKLRLHKPDDTARLTAVLQEAVKKRRTLPWPHVMAFEVPGQAGPNVLQIDQFDDGAENAPPGVKGPFEGSTNPPYFIITVRVRSLLRTPSVEHIRVGLGLTPKQAEAVYALVRGESIDKQAVDRGLSVDGVRWHFKNIYQRTGCSNQAELVRLVVSLFSSEQPGS